MQDVSKRMSLSTPPLKNSVHTYEQPGHLRPVILKPVGRIFEISDSKPIRGKRGKCGKSLSPKKNKGLRRFRRAITRKTRKMRKMRTRKRMTGFNVTGFREPHLNPPVRMNFPGFSLLKKGERQKVHTNRGVQMWFARTFARTSHVSDWIVGRGTEKHYIHIINSWGLNFWLIA